MILLANILSGIATILDMLLNLTMMIVLIRALLSWVNPDPFNPIVRFVRETTEPMLRPLRKFVPDIGGRIDLTPIVLILIVLFLKVALVQTLADYAYSMRMTILR